MESSTRPGLDAHEVKQQTVDQLVHEFGEVFPRARIAEAVAASHDHVVSVASYDDFVPLLTRRYAREWLLHQLPGRGRAFLQRRRG